MNTKVLLAVVVIAFAVCMVTAKSRASFHSYDKVSFFQYLFFLDERVCFQVGNEWWDFKKKRDKLTSNPVKAGFNIIARILSRS